MFKKRTTQLFFLLIAAASPLTASPSTAYGKRPHERSQPQIVVHNRPLAKVNNKMFSVLDVKKKMDAYLSKTHPEIFKEPESVYQFYVHSWRNVLQEMIDGELMLMEAESLAYKMDKNYIREEFEERFGSNTALALDTLGMTQEEAEKLVEEDLVCRSMMWYRVWQKAINEITPEVVKAHYAQQMQNRQSQDEWTYQMCTIKGNDAQAAEKIAHELKTMLSSFEKGVGSSLSDAIKSLTALAPSDISIKLSDDIHLTSQELSKENLNILEKLETLGISEPIKQKSRYDNQTVMRLFHLKEHLIKAPPAFEEVESQIKESLVAKNGEKIKNEYMEKLRQRFCCQHLVVEKMYNAQLPIFTLAS